MNEFCDAPRDGFALMAPLKGQAAASRADGRDEPMFFEVLRRVRAVVHMAVLDGSVQKTLWANADETLLDYLDLAIDHERARAAVKPAGRVTFQIE